MKIGELAIATDTPIDTIRHYESAGLLPAPTRSEANYRIYGEGHAQRLLFIRRCRSLDMSLEEVRVLLRFRDSPSDDCREVNALLDQHIGHVADRVRELRTLEKQLKALRETCRQATDTEHCGILNGLSQAQRTARKTTSRQRHVLGTHKASR